MKRRQFIKTAGLSVTVAALAAPAIAQANPEIRWRLPSSFPKSLDILYGAAETIAKFTAEMTDNKFQIQCFGAGEIVPPLNVLDAVQDGTVEACHTAMYYFWGKDPTFAFGTAVPFGMNLRQMDAWFHEGGGNALIDEFLADYKVVGMPAGNTGTQMGGWFRKEIKTVQDFSGLKFRVAGFAGAVLQKLGAVPQVIAAGDIYPALEKGTLDAVEFVGPYDDEKLGFNKVAPIYHYPGWWEGAAALHLLISKEKFEALPKHYQNVLRRAAQIANKECQTKYDAANPAALKRLVAAGTQFRPFPQDVMEASWKASNEVTAEVAAKNAKFKKMNDAYQAFRNDQYLWWQVAEYSFDNFMIRQRAK